MRRQFLFGARVREIVANVGEESALGREFFDRLQRALDGGVRGMRAVPERIQEQHIQTLQLLPGFFGDIAVIRQIRGLSEAESVDRAFTVAEADGGELETADIDGRTVEYVGGEPRNRGFGLVVGKDVMEAAPDIFDV